MKIDKDFPNRVDCSFCIHSDILNGYCFKFDDVIEFVMRGQEVVKIEPCEQCKLGMKDALEEILPTNPAAHQKTTVDSQ